jgi:hypothetical protein
MSVNAKLPSGPGWHFVALIPGVAESVMQKWEHVGEQVIAISSLDRTTNGEEFHVSVTLAGRRCNDAKLAFVRAEFDMAEAEEDNHLPQGQARHLWLNVDPSRRKPCECKHEARGPQDGAP